MAGKSSIRYLLTIRCLNGLPLWKTTKDAIVTAFIKQFRHRFELGGGFCAHSSRLFLFMNVADLNFASRFQKMPAQPSRSWCSFVKE